MNKSGLGNGPVSISKNLVINSKRLSISEPILQYNQKKQVQSVGDSEIPHVFTDSPNRSENPGLNNIKNKLNNIDIEEEEPFIRNHQLTYSHFPPKQTTNTFDSDEFNPMEII
ncbi:hypothetical protein EDI_338700 [Entamoeba dispar SAW760]|uniref:Uncharacterized protein n=1 Tax=Entamoeba dispar (strain ATCC PRA-260 / SAW760) TaxID=370354 RepID=B0E7S9_ENTDS|nr:uncharacterized protein EDI_338700 [Entamoeba dispar SAW760]EDR29401.1 hypothetical protein EDI_338700 [Entamoeba dispar SAW760]|eukprot:EDR29401.1 hypothetical protein EDI_338700 [Entamoeba dispar SAW760]